MQLRRYANHSGDSGVEAFALRDDAVLVRFRNNPRVYVYSVASAGAAHVMAMASRAAAGRGLATYISQHVADGYER